MMRMATIALAGLAAACAPADDPMAGDRPMPEPSASASYTVGGPDDPVKLCAADRARGLVGRTADAATQAEAQRLTGARAVRVLAPGAMATMDFRSDRLNIRTDAANRILSLDCG